MYRQLQKDILNSNMVSSQYGELSSLTAEISWRVWGTPENFSGFRISCLGFVAALTSLIGGQGRPSCYIHYTVSQKTTLVLLTVTSMHIN